MHEPARIGYAQARVQARLGARPSEAFWRELEAGRELAHLVDWVRTSALAAAVTAVPADVDIHALESRLRRHWAATCEEIAGWYPQSARESMRWLRWLPLLPALASLSRGKPIPPWLRQDPALGTIVSAEPDERAGQLRERGLAPLAQAFAESADLAAAWHRHWRDSWPAASGTALERLDRALARLQPGAEAGRGPGFDALVDATGAEARRLFRRNVCTPTAGLCLLVLLWLDQLRLRAALATARLFGAGEAT